MSDYEKRLQRLEEQATIADDSGALLMEAVRKRTAELLSSKEVLALELPDVPEEELAARVEALRAAASLKAGQDAEAQQLAAMTEIDPLQPVALYGSGSLQT